MSVLVAKSGRELDGTSAREKKVTIYCDKEYCYSGRIDRVCVWPWVRKDGEKTTRERVSGEWRAWRERVSEHGDGVWVALLL